MTRFFHRYIEKLDLGGRTNRNGCGDHPRVMRQLVNIGKPNPSDREYLFLPFYRADCQPFGRVYTYTHCALQSRYTMISISIFFIFFRCATFFLTSALGRLDLEHPRIIHSEFSTGGLRRKKLNRFQSPLAPMTMYFCIREGHVNVCGTFPVGGNYPPFG